MSTETKDATIKSLLDKADPNKLSDLLRKIQLGTMLTPLKRTFTDLDAASEFDLTAIDGDDEDAGADNPNRLAALVVGTLRVTAGTAESGPRHVTDSGGTAAAGDLATNGSAGIATISDDGKTITFEDDVTAFVIEYVPRAAVDLTDDFPTTGLG